MKTGKTYTKIRKDFDGTFIKIVKVITNNEYTITKTHHTDEEAKSEPFKTSRITVPTLTTRKTPQQ